MKVEAVRRVDHDRPSWLSAQRETSNESGHGCADMDDVVLPRLSHSPDAPNRLQVCQRERAPRPANLPSPCECTVYRPIGRNAVRHRVDCPSALGERGGVRKKECLERACDGRDHEKAMATGTTARTHSIVLVRNVPRFAGAWLGRHG